MSRTAVFSNIGDYSIGRNNFRQSRFEDILNEREFKNQFEEDRDRGIQDGIFGEQPNVKPTNNTEYVESKIVDGTLDIDKFDDIYSNINSEIFNGTLPISKARALHILQGVADEKDRKPLSFTDEDIRLNPTVLQAIEKEFDIQPNDLFDENSKRPQNFIKAIQSANKAFTIEDRLFKTPEDTEEEKKARNQLLTGINAMLSGGQSLPDSTQIPSTFNRSVPFQQPTVFGQQIPSPESEPPESEPPESESPSDNITRTKNMGKKAFKAGKKAFNKFINNPAVHNVVRTATRVITEPVETGKRIADESSKNNVKFDTENGKFSDTAIADLKKRLSIAIDAFENQATRTRDKDSAHIADHFSRILKNLERDGVLSDEDLSDARTIRVAKDGSFKFVKKKKNEL